MFEKVKKIDFEGIAITAGIIGFLTLIGIGSFQLQVTDSENTTQSPSNHSINW
jgi:hypothetical protein